MPETIANILLNQFLFFLNQRREVSMTIRKFLSGRKSPWLGMNGNLLRGYWGCYPKERAGIRL